MVYLHLHNTEKNILHNNADISKEYAWNEVRLCVMIVPVSTVIFTLFIYDAPPEFPYSAGLPTGDTLTLICL